MRRSVSPLHAQGEGEFRDPPRGPSAQKGGRADALPPCENLNDASGPSQAAQSIHFFLAGASGLAASGLASDWPVVALGLIHALDLGGFAQLGDVVGLRLAGHIGFRSGP